MRMGVFYGGFHGRGGAERLAMELALAGRGLGYQVGLLTDVDVNRDEIERDLGLDTTGIQFLQLPSAAVHGRFLYPRQRLAWWNQWRSIRALKLDVFINAQYKSEIPGAGSRNIYYAHFPHLLAPFAERGIKRAYMAAVNLSGALALGRVRGFPSSYPEIWANSEFAADHVRLRWGREAKVVYPACEAMVPRAKEKVIIAVGRFQAPGPGVPYKAQDVLIDAFSGLRDLHDAGWKLILAGGAGTGRADQDYLARIRRLARGLPVEIVVDAPYVEIQSLYGRATIYWHAQGIGRDAVAEPHTQEHFGITTVEAMSAGCIPLVINTGGPKEIVAPVDPELVWSSVEQLRTSTRYWAGNQADRASMAAHCRARAEEFSRSAFQRRVAELLE